MTEKLKACRNDKCPKCDGFGIEQDVCTEEGIDDCPYCRGGGLISLAVEARTRDFLTNPRYADPLYDFIVGLIYPDTSPTEAAVTYERTTCATTGKEYALVPVGDLQRPSPHITKSAGCVFCDIKAKHPDGIKCDIHQPDKTVEILSEWMKRHFFSPKECTDIGELLHDFSRQLQELKLSTLDDQFTIAMYKELSDRHEYLCNHKLKVIEELKGVRDAIKRSIPYVDGYSVRTDSKSDSSKADESANELREQLSLINALIIGEK